MSDVSITIITPNLNGERFLEACINSVKCQNYRNINHIIIDGGSSDNSHEILDKNNVRYEVVLGLNNYEAVDYGFSKYPGDIFCWLNSDDVFQSGALHVVASVFHGNPNIKWLTGQPSTIDEYGSIRVSNCSEYPQYGKYSCLLNEKYYLQQESTFWRSTIYKTEYLLSDQFKVANDFYLWSNFFKSNSLYFVPRVLSSFRVHSGDQISFKNKHQYLTEINSINMESNFNIFNLTILKLAIKVDYLLINTPLIKHFYNRLNIRQSLLGFTDKLTF